MRGVDDHGLQEMYLDVEARLTGSTILRYESLPYLA